MFAWARIVVVLYIALLEAGCAGSGVQYLDNGVGTTLSSANLPDNTALQELYVQHICQQAGLQGCGPGIDLGSDWAVFVQAGMNDIDERCDGYMQWLDARKRNAGPILKEISDLGRAAVGIMRVSGVGADAITIAGLAFGLAADTFTNVSSRLIFEINQSTVQAVVLRRQNEYRLGLPRLINNRPAAIHALRSYLRLCMPFTIETDINTSVTLFERTGERIKPLVTPDTVRVQSIKKVTKPIAPVILPPRVIVAGDVRQGAAENSFTVSQVVALQKAVCFKPVDGQFTLATRDAILAFLNTTVVDGKPLKDMAAPEIITAKDAANLRHLPVAAGGC